MVTIDMEKCIGCGLCVKDCFVGVLQMQDGKASVLADCFKCGHCVAVCPKNAVSIPDYPMKDVREYDESCKMNPENLLHFMQFRRSVRAQRNTGNHSGSRQIYAYGCQSAGCFLCGGAGFSGRGKAFALGLPEGTAAGAGSGDLQRADAGVL